MQTGKPDKANLSRWEKGNREEQTARRDGSGVSALQTPIPIHSYRLLHLCFWLPLTACVMCWINLLRHWYSHLLQRWRKENQKEKTYLCFTLFPSPLPFHQLPTLFTQIDVQLVCTFVAVVEYFEYHPCFSNPHPCTCIHPFMHVPATTRAWRIKTRFCLSQRKFNNVPFLAQ